VTQVVMGFRLTIVERKRAAIELFSPFFITATKTNISQIRVGDRKLRIELEPAHVKRLRFVERRGVFIERARARVELVRGLRATGCRAGTKHTHHIAAQRLDAEVEHELTGNRLERAATGSTHHDASTIA